MKKEAMTILLSLMCLGSQAMDFTKPDSRLGNPAEYTSVRDELLSLVPKAADNGEKAEIYWRLARVQMLLGEKAASKEEKQALFGEGIKYAEAGIKENRDNHNCYMWHCANMGRECQTRKLMEQAKAVPAMLNDLSNILNRLGKTNCSEAWQALSEIYCNHPFKSTDAGINFARKAATCIPSGELRLSTYIYMAGLLSERGWSADKRCSEMKANAGKFTGRDNIEKYSWFDAGLGCSHTPKWSSKALGEMSDKEESAAIVDYAMKLYKSASHHTATDNADYAKLGKMKNKQQ